MYGALGKNASHTTAARTMTTYTSTRRVEAASVYATPANTNGTQASARFQSRNQ